MSKYVSERPLQVVLVDTGQADKSLDRTLRVLAVWYVLLAALEDVETQRKGFCFIVNLKASRISQVCSWVRWKRCKVSALFSFCACLFASRANCCSSHRFDSLALQC